MLDEFRQSITSAADLAICIAFPRYKCSLDSLIRAGTFSRSPGTITHVSFQVLDALAFLHQRKIVHCDLKPQNILLTDEMHVKLCDFGHAHVVETLNQRENRDNYVTLWYRDPSLLIGSKTVIHYHIDMWSFGCLMLEMLIGRAYFNGRDPRDQLRLIITALGRPRQDLYKGANPFWIVDNDIIAFIDSLPQRPSVPFVYALPFSIDKRTIDLIMAILIYDPRKRPTAIDCMRNPVYRNLFKPLENRFTNYKISSFVSPNKQQSLKIDTLLPSPVSSPNRSASWNQDHWKTDIFSPALSPASLEPDDDI